MAAPIIRRDALLKICDGDVDMARKFEALFQVLYGGTPTFTNVKLTGLPASQAVQTDPGQFLTTIANTGTGANVLATGATLTSPTITSPTASNPTLTGVIKIDLLQPLSGTVAGDTTYTITTGQGWYTVYIPASYLVASAAGPFTLTLTTGAGTTVKVPIVASGDTISSGALLFDVYVDGSGNVTSKAWEITGSNSNGSYCLEHTGEMQSRGSTTPASNNNSGTSVTFPFAFNANPAVSTRANAIASGGTTGSYVAEAGSVSTTTCLVKVLTHVATAVNDSLNVQIMWLAAGRWRA